MLATLAGCVGENPVDVDARSKLFAMIGGLAVGEAISLRGLQAERIDLPGRQGGAEYVVIPFLGTEQSGTVTIDIDRAVRVEAVGPPAATAPSPDAPGLGGRPLLATRASTALLHERLRRSEIERLEPSLRSSRWQAADLRPRAAGGPARVPVVGEILSLRAINDASVDLCENPLVRGGRVAAVSARSVVVVDTLSPAQPSPADIASLAAEIDNTLLPVTIEHFGEPTDLDVNSRVTVFFTPVVNDRGAAGFFFAGDLFASGDCPASNESEIVYVFSPDPLGQTNLQIDAEDVAFLASSVVAHELQHLINASRRVWVNDATQFEAVWMNEGLSHIAEELVFHATTPFGSRENIELDDLIASPELAEAADRFVVGNFFFYGRYAADPTDASLSGSDSDATRGAAWAFLRYAADHEGRPDDEIFFELANSTNRGLATLDGVLEQGDALSLMQAWTASVFADDHVADVPEFLTQPSWDFRSILPAITQGGLFPLMPYAVQSQGGPVQLTLGAGGSFFLRIAVANEGASELRLDLGGTSVGSLRVSVIRVR